MTLLEKSSVEQAALILAALHGRCRPGAYASGIIGRGGGAQDFRIPAGYRGDLLPAQILDEYARRAPDDVRVSLGTTFSDGRGSDLPALFCEFAHTSTFDRSRPDGRKWVPTPADVDATAAAIARFPLPPSFVMDQFNGYLAVWLLTEPCRLDLTRTRQQATALQQQLAEILEGRQDIVEREKRPGASAGPPAWHYARVVLRPPGTRCCDAGADGQPVRLINGDLDRHYTLDAIADAMRADRPAQRRAR